MSKSQPPMPLTELAKLSQPGQQLTDNFFNDLTQLSNVDTEIAQVLQSLYAAHQLSRDAILRKLAEMRGKQND